MIQEHTFVDNHEVRDDKGRSTDLLRGTEHSERDDRRDTRQGDSPIARPDRFAGQV